MDVKLCTLALWLCILPLPVPGARNTPRRLRENVAFLLTSVSELRQDVSQMKADVCRLQGRRDPDGDLAAPGRCSETDEDTKLSNTIKQVKGIIQKKIRAFEHGNRRNGRFAKQLRTFWRLVDRLGRGGDVRTRRAHSGSEETRAAVADLGQRLDEAVVSMGRRLEDMSKRISDLEHVVSELTTGKEADPPSSTHKSPGQITSGSEQWKPKINIGISDYQLFFGPVSWSSAKEACSKKTNGYLAELADGAGELKQQKLKHYLGNTTVWLGVTYDNTKGEWRGALTGNVMTWMKKEMKGSGNHGNCCSYSGHRKTLSAASCSEAFAYLCGYDK